uniref:Uncharacterized protein n=1 Tax=Anopheles atroparvus TaxID=41427 RepID=A0A182JMB1_ANOAO
LANKRPNMDKGRHITRICFCLVAMVIITVPHGVISLPCTTGTNGQMVNTIGMRAPEGARSSPALVAPVVLRTDTDYVDSSPSVRTTSKVNTARRQYTVPQLFVSYGWGPMG